MRKVVVLLLWFIGCTPIEKSEQTEITPIASGESFNAAFLVIDGVYNSELMAPYDIFQHTIFHAKGGIAVFTVSESLDTVTTFEGLRLLPDFSFDSPDLPDIDILVVPSAEHNMDTDLENERLIQWVSSIGEKAKYVVSLCDGAFVLAKAGLVDDRESTTFPSDIDRYKQTFPQLKVHDGVSFVHDQNLLTSSGGAKSYDVALYLVHYLFGEEIAKRVGKGLVIDWNLNDYKYIAVE